MVFKPKQKESSSASSDRHSSQSIQKKLSRLLSLERIISSISVLCVLLLWYVSTALEWVSPLFLPSPVAVWAAFVEILQSGYKGNSLLFHIYESMYRMVVALVLAVVTAIPLGMLCGFSKHVRAALDPLIEFYRPLPPLAYYTLLVIWLGIENPSKVALLYLAAFAPLYIAAVSGVQRIPRERINASLSLGASKWQVFVYVVFPSCLPELFTGLRTAIGFSYTTLVAAEMVAAVSGIGWMVLDASKFLRSDVIFVGIIIMGVIAMLIDFCVRWVQKSQLPWIGHDT
jgi:taurine transport system permease protein